MRSESFPVPPGPEMLDETSDGGGGPRAPSQPAALTVSLTESQRLQTGGTGRLRWWRTGTGFSTPRRGLAQCLKTGCGGAPRARPPPASTPWPMCWTRSRAGSYRARSAPPGALLDGPAGTGKTVVAAHRFAMVAPPGPQGLCAVPSAALAAYLHPALPRLGSSKLAPSLLASVVQEPRRPGRPTACTASSARRRRTPAASSPLSPRRFATGLPSCCSLRTGARLAPRGVRRRRETVGLRLWHPAARASPPGVPTVPRNPRCRRAAQAPDPGTRWRGRTRWAASPEDRRWRTGWRWRELRPPRAGWP